MSRVIGHIYHKAERIYADLLTERGLKFIYQPATFWVGARSYRPDFYLIDEHVFIEVIGTRQAYSLNRFLYDEFRKVYPMIVLRIVNPDDSEYLPGKSRSKKNEFSDKPIDLSGLYYRPDHVNMDHKLVREIIGACPGLPWFCRTFGIKMSTIESVSNGKSVLYLTQQKLDRAVASIKNRPTTQQIT